MKRNSQDYLKQSTADAARFIDGLEEAAKSEVKGQVFDSAAGVDFVENAIKGTSNIVVPDTVQAVFDEAKDDGERQLIASAILDGCRSYEAAHGVAAPADVVEQALHSAYATTHAARERYKAVFDNANSAHSDNLSLQPNRAVVAILGTFTEAIPFAHYLPADIGSNEAKLAILSHEAGSAHGAYAVGGSMDGVNSGSPYLSNARIHTMKDAEQSGTLKGKLTVLQTSFDECAQSGSGVKLMRGRTVVYVNGIPCAYDTTVGSGAESPIAGSVTLEDGTHTITGKINVDTGEFDLTINEHLGAEVPVAVEGFIDLERAPELTPEVISHVKTYSLFANPWRAITRQTIDTRTQMSNELGLDPYSESILAINSQFANERHYMALAKGMRIAQNNQQTFDFGDARKHQDNSRAEVWRDLAQPLGVLDQQMAEDTMSHGITHLYVGKNVASQLMAMSGFEPSGITARPGIFRLGRLFKRYEVYYSPKIVKDTPDAAQILCVGRAPDVARNPIVLGEAVAPTVMPLGLNADLRQGAGFYARNFTCVNPHEASSKGFAILNVTNMGASS